MDDNLIKLIASNVLEVKLHKREPIILFTLITFCNRDEYTFLRENSSFERRPEPYGNPYKCIRQFELDPTVTLKWGEQIVRAFVFDRFFIPEEETPDYIIYKPPPNLYTFDEGPGLGRWDRKRILKHIQDHPQLTDTTWNTWKIFDIWDNFMINEDSNLNLRIYYPLVSLVMIENLRTSDSYDILLDKLNLRFLVDETGKRGFYPIMVQTWLYWLITGKVYLWNLIPKFFKLQVSQGLMDYWDKYKGDYIITDEN